MHRLIGNFNLNNRQIKIFDPGVINQLKNVLKLKAGEKIK